MFSIAAINETEASGQWEPLAPTKEAQEFHLSQKYHEGLLKLQDKDYVKARELLEAVLKDPLISTTQVDNVGSDHHLLQLRFLSLKNLANVFLQQGSMYYESALHCYLQAVELDINDSVVWNKLGTLSCTMGLLSTSRWAFEQGLLCSPNNWNCMEKLLEVLIAIGDEVSCLSVANLLLKHWPSHSRALHVKKVIEDAEPVPFAPRGIDKLEPKHVTLKFHSKRKRADDEIENISMRKKGNQNIELQLTEATWSAVLDAIFSIFSTTKEKVWEPDVIDDHRGAIDGDTSTCERIFSIQKNAESFVSNKINICLPTNLEIVEDSAEGSTPNMCPVGESISHDSYVSIKDKDNTSMGKEHAHERRSTRLERLRSRKSGKDELETNGKDMGKVVFQFLDSFILRRPCTEDADCSGSSDGPYPDINSYTSNVERNDVAKFVSKVSKNCGTHHIGHLLLEEVAHIDAPFQGYFMKFLDLEKITRYWGQDRSPLCSLFLAELYYDQGSCCSNNFSSLDFFHEASYHLCKVIELVSLDSPFDLVGGEIHLRSSKTTMKMNDSSGSPAHPNTISRKEITDPPNSFQNASELLVGSRPCPETSESRSSLTNNFAFWVRFFWLSGCLSLSSGCKEKAYDAFNISLSLLRTKSLEEKSNFIFLPHCKLVRSLTVDRVLHQINLIKLDSLLLNDGEIIKKGTHAECVNLLSPLILSTKDVYLDVISGGLKEMDRVISLELSALDVLISACEKEEQKNIQVYLNCRRRKLHILTVAAGIVGSLASQKDKQSSPRVGSASDLDFGEPVSKNWFNMVVEEVRDVSLSASRVKNFISQSDSSCAHLQNGQDGFSSIVCILADIQSLLLAVMCSAVKLILMKKLSSSGASNHADQLESWCLIDAAIAFCKIQHLVPSVSVKSQVDLIVAVHDLLAEYGLCCAGRDSAGEEGTFLKFAIKHLLALDVKLKSLHSRNGKDENTSLQKIATEDISPGYIFSHDEQDKIEDELDSEIEKIELGIDNALDQAFFCLYGLKINPDSSSEDDLAIHKNTSRGEYQTKEQCADVFQYLLPYARALSRAGLVKLRRVLRAIRKHFPQPPDDVLTDNAIDRFLDGPDSYEKKLREVSETTGSHDAIMSILFTKEKEPETFKKLSVVSSGPYLEVYSNLYYYIAQAEEISATDKYPGFVLKKEGEEFVEHNANLFKYDLLYNPLRFESWQKLANIYDEEVDLLLNDGSKHINILDWGKSATLPQRVAMGRRRSRRCLLMSLTLASTPLQQSQIHELLALVYYDSLQNVVPFYDQRSIVPKKDETWSEFCQNSLKHFEKAFALKPEWLHAFYIGKLCEKLEHSPAKAFSYYSKAMDLNPSAVDPVYRMHASRLKLLYTKGKENLDVLKFVAAYAFHQSTKDRIQSLFGWTSWDLPHTSPDMIMKDFHCSDNPQEKKDIQPDLLYKVWHILYDDCLSALGICVEGELKHFHKARYMIAQGLYRRGELGDTEKAKDELSFCFKSSRSSFTVNMWEIDGTVRKGRRRNPGVGGSKKNLEVSLSESSRKFITCIRKYMLLYLILLEKTGDLWTLEKAYQYLRTDKRFWLCLGDIVPVGLGKFIQVLTSAIRNAETRGTTNDTMSLEQLLEKMFTVFMDHANLWTDISSLPEVNSPESHLYGTIHQYIHLLESDVRLDALEGLNEKMRKRFKSPKLSNNNFAKICKHASLAWCRSILIKLALITPTPDAEHLNDQPATSGNGLLLYVDLQPDELLIVQPEGSSQFKGLDMNWFEALSKMKNIQIRQTSEENMEAAVTLMRCTYNFYRESSCGTFPSGVSLYTMLSSQSPGEGLQTGQDVVDILDLSIPRKLLLWAYTLVHGRYSNISAVVKYCEEMKLRMKRGNSSLSAPSQATTPTGGATAGGGRDKFGRDEFGENEDKSSVSVTCASSHQEESTSGAAVAEAQKSTVAPSQLHRCNSSKTMENVPEGSKRSNGTG